MVPLNKTATNKMAIFRQGYRSAQTTTHSSTPKGRVMSLLARSISSTQVNPDGFPSYEELSLWQEYARVVFSNLIKGEFYKDSTEAANESREIHIRAVQADPIRHLKGLVKAREMNLKAQVQIGLAVFMSFVPAEQWRMEVSDTQGHPFLPSGGAPWPVSIEDVLVELMATLTPKQLFAVVEMLRYKIFGKGLGWAAKRAISRAMGKWSPRFAEYYSIVYKDEINRLLRWVHPPKKYLGADNYRLLHAAVDDAGKIATERQKVAQQLLSSNPRTFRVSDEEFARLLIEYDLDWESTKQFAQMQSPVHWLTRMLQMNTNALLLNLRSLENKGVFSLDGALDYLNEKLSGVGKARVLPMDIVRAYMQVKNPSVKDALKKAFAASFQYKIPEWEGKRVAFFLDLSGSMSGNAIVRSASIAASLLPSVDQEDLTFGTFDTRLALEGQDYDERRSNRYYGYHYRLRCPKITGEAPEVVLDRLFSMEPAGGTDTSVGIKYLLDNSIYKDVIIIVTDEQQNTGQPMYKLFKQYQRQVNPNATLYIINPTSYKWHNAFQKDPSVLTVNTVTPSLFRAMPGISMAEEIVDKVSLHDFVARARYARRSNYTYRPQYLIP